MHAQPPSDPEGEYLPPTAPPEYARYAAPARPARGWRATGGLLAGLAVLLAKFKTLLLLLLNLKWLLLFKPLLSLSTFFVSIWIYALFFGWKFGVVFVLLMLVHELGHYLTFRNFGIAASLPFFIPGFGAFVAARGPAPNLTVEALAALAGPVFGIGASAVCFAYGISAHEPFWYAAAYLGFFMNAFNLLPLPPFDGGRIAAAIDPRLWLVGLVGLLVFLSLFALWSSFTIVILVLVALTAVPRIVALLNGRVDPRFRAVPPLARLALAAAYFVTLGLAVIGALATYVDPHALSAG